jgi:hypothetical protein
MNKKIYILYKIRLIGVLSTFVLYSSFAYTQLNLVPNPSFEIYDTCPQDLFNPPYSGISAICRAIPWFQPNSPYHFCSGSSDYFHQCAFKIPQNLSGYQYARTGLGYAGAGPTGNPNSEGGEYIEVPLLQTLKQKMYCTSFYVNTPNVDWSSTNCIQARFTKDSLISNSFDRIYLSDGIGATEIVRDTVNWVLVKGIYDAKGEEKFMTVGCFVDITWDDYLCSETQGCGFSYYYFDDFGVYELPEISAGLGGEIDTLGESVSLQANCEGCWNDLVYRWWPSVGLSDTTILNPIATPEVTTTYYFGLIDTSETVPCIVDLVDSVTVFVTIPQDTITPPPTSFSWLVYPSPTNGNLTVQFSGLSSDSQLLIIDARGRLVRKIVVPKNTESLPLDISSLAAGEYFLQLENSGLKQRRKVVKF